MSRIWNWLGKAVGPPGHLKHCPELHQLREQTPPIRRPVVNCQVLTLGNTGSRVLLFSAGLMLGVMHAAAQVVVRGQVQEAETLQPLASAHVIVEGASRGTITNHQGEFEITLRALPAVLLVRHLGYAIARIEVEQNDPRMLSVLLEPSIFEMPELLVTGDVFADNVMREVIRRKATRRTYLHAYSARGYSRITLESTGEIVLVSEHVYDRYHDTARGVRHVIRSSRSTASFWQALGFTPASLDLSRDHVQIRELSFIGPTNPNALDHYHFTLAGRRQFGLRYIYDIYVAPKTGLEATFTGRISVMDSVYALLEADLRPAPHVVFGPDVIDWDLFYRQQFAPVDSFWLPVDLRIDGRIHVEPEGMTTGPAAVQQIIRLFDYATNPPVPEEVFAQNVALQVDTVSVQRDDLFLMGLDMVALTPRELEALGDLRRAPPLTLAQALPTQRKQRIAEFETRSFSEGDLPQFTWPSFGGYVPRLRYNRVDGMFVGVGTILHSGKRIQMAARIAKALSYGNTRIAGALTWHHSDRFSSTLVFERDMQLQQGAIIHSVAMNSLSSRLLQQDFFDWYWADGGHVMTRYHTGSVRARLTYRIARHIPVERTIETPWPFRQSFPPNLGIDRGPYSSMEVAIATGSDWQPYHINPQRRAELSLERGSTGFEDAFWRLRLRADTYIKTIFIRRPKPAHLALRVLAGSSRGALPRVSWNTLEGSMGPVAALGVIRSLRSRRLAGDHTMGFFWEHDFRTLPFEALHLNSVVGRDVSLRVGGAHARVWPREDWYHELTLSAAMAPVRLDLTRSLDRPGWYVTVGLAGRR